VSFQNQPINPSQNCCAQLITESIIQQQFLNHSQYNAAVAQPQYALPGQVYNQAAIPTQQLLSQQVLIVALLNAPPHPFYWKYQLLQGITPSAVEAIYQADELNQGHHDGDVYNNNEDYNNDKDYDNNSDQSSHILLCLVKDNHWVAALQGIITYPCETLQVGIQRRTPLHVACNHDAPPPSVQALLGAWPAGVKGIRASHMNLLHITCSSPHASVDIMRVLLVGC
jgi:hypothetical protein